MVLYIVFINIPNVTIIPPNINNTTKIEKAETKIINRLNETNTNEIK